MAGFSWIVHLVLVSLLGSALGSDVGHPEWTLKASGCDCTDYYYVEEVPYHVLDCTNINTTDEVACVDNFLTNITNEKYEAINLEIGYSNLNLFPDNFMVPYPIYDVQFYSCGLSEIPYRIINPICSRLSSLILTYNDIESVPANGFNNCSVLIYLALNYNRISSVSPQAFVGSESLVILDLEMNNLQTLSNFPGLVNLEELLLLENKISKVDKDALVGMGNLMLFYLDMNQITTLEEGTFDPLVKENIHVQLEGNPFYCDCNLQWLQDWLNTKPQSDDPYCVAPIQGPIKTTDFCALTGSKPARKSLKLTQRIWNHAYKKMHGN